MHCKLYCWMLTSLFRVSLYLLMHHPKTKHIQFRNAFCRLWQAAPLGDTQPGGHQHRPHGPVGASPMRARGRSSPSPCLPELERSSFKRGPISFTNEGPTVPGRICYGPARRPAALSCPPPPREPIVPNPSGGCCRQIYRGRRPAGQGLRSTAGRGTRAQPRGPLTRPAVTTGAAEGCGAAYLLGFALHGPLAAAASFFIVLICFLSRERFVRSCVGGTEPAPPPR